MSRKTQIKHRSVLSASFILALTAIISTLCFADHRPYATQDNSNYYSPSYHRTPQINTRPIIRGIYPQTCEPQGGTIVLYGTNLKSQRLYSLTAGYGKNRFKLQPVSWSNTRIIATIPRHAPLKPGQRLVVGISKRGRSRWISNRNMSLAICRNPASQTPRNPALPSGNYEPQQVIVISPSIRTAKRLSNTLSARGYRLKSREHYPELNLTISVLLVPNSLSVSKSVNELRNQYPQYIIDANHLYSLHRGENSKYKAMINWGRVPTSCGRGLRLGLLDTNIEKSHRLFRGRYIVNRSFLPAGVVPAPKLHATAIASIWLSNTTGLAPSAEVYVASVFRKGKQRVVNTNTKWLVDGIAWLVRRNVDVVNLSFGGPRSKALEHVIQRAQSKGIIFVASAGNNGPGAAPVYPAAYPNVIAVTAVDSRFKIYRKANRGNYIDFAAPGVNIPVAKPGNRKKIVSGTSFAAPYVVAAMGILKKRNHSSQASMVNKLSRTSKDLGVRGKDRLYGWGLIQMNNACR